MIKKGIYLASFKAYHPKYNIVYQDINGQRDIGGDMMDVDLSEYDFIIASPPCNYYSRANYRRDTSFYAQKTKNLLPDILKKLIDLGKPFIIENVRNSVLMSHLNNFGAFVYEYGRHTYFTNILFDLTGVVQINDKVQDRPSSIRQGGINVHNVIDRWLQYL